MTRFRIVIANDGLTAELQAAAGAAANEQELRRACAEAGVTTGIDDAAIADAASQLANPNAVVATIIARGYSAKHGQDARLRGLPRNVPEPGRVTPSGRIDYRERHFLQPIADTEVIATVVPETSGSAAIDVRGRELPAIPGKPLPQQLGPGARRTGDTIFAKRDGVVLHTEAVLDVVPLYTHSGNVDYASGNLHTKGSLLVEGDIGNGFQVTADGDIAVLGTVHGELQAQGSALIERGILGQQLVRAGTDLICHHATNSNLSAARTLVVEDQATQCQAKAKTVRITNGRAAVRGGQILARDHIEVGSAGAPAGTTTLLAVAQLIDERTTIVRLSSATLRQTRIVQRSLDQGRGSKGLRKLVKASNHESSEQLRLKRRQRELLRDATIRVQRTCYGGVIVKFGMRQLRIDADLHEVTFRYDLETDSIQTQHQNTPS